MKTFLLFVATALAEILGCYLPYMWLREGKSVWLLVPAALSLFVFSWLLTLHPTAAGRVYAAYGGVYISAALMWLWLVEGITPGKWDFVGVGICLIGMSVIMHAPRDGSPTHSSRHRSATVSSAPDVATRSESEAAPPTEEAVVAATQ